MKSAKNKYDGNSSEFMDDTKNIEINSQPQPSTENEDSLFITVCDFYMCLLKHYVLYGVYKETGTL